MPFGIDAARALAIALVTTTLVLGSAGQVCALDPDRTLTQYLHRIWQRQQGLPPTTIFVVRQTADGYLWLGTQTGLVRFDGVRFTPIAQAGDISLQNLQIRDLAEDHQRGLWIASDGGGLIRLHNGKSRQFTKADGLPSDKVQCLSFDSRGKLWIGTSAGAVRYSPEQMAFAALDELAQRDVRAIYPLPDGTVWLGGDGAALGIWDGTRFDERTLESIGANATITAIKRTKDGVMWIGTTAGLLRIENNQERRFSTADGLADDWIHCLTEGRDGGLWIGTKEGFSRLRDGEFESFRPRDGLSQSTVFTLCEDHEGSLWAGTKYGLNQFSDRRTIPFTVNEGLPSNDTGPVLEGVDGKIWIGTLGAGLTAYDGRRFATLTTADGLASDTIVALAGGDDGDLWIGTDKGLNRLSAEGIVATYTSADGLPSDAINCVIFDKYGELWIGTSAGLAHFNSGKFERLGDSQELSMPILALAEQRRQLVVAAGGGRSLFRRLPGRFVKLTLPGLPESEIDAFCEDADGRLWLGSRGGGLCVVYGDKVHSYSIQDGLYDDAIYGIVADDEDRLWMACSKGIFSVNCSDLRKFSAGLIKSFESTPFSPTDALRTIECKTDVQPVACKMQDGRLWFSTTRGLIVIDPRRLDRKLPPAPVVVEEVVVNGESRAPADVDVLSPGQTNLSFRYTALSFRSPTRITFRYRLDGFDRDWIDAGTRREAFYTNLSPGKYQFRVMARNIDGEFHQLTDPIAFSLQPYFYQRRWFWPLCGAMAAVAAWLAFRLRVRRVREHLQLVIAERSRIARELHDTLMQGFAGVTMEMQALLARLPASEERGTLEEIIGDAGSCLREARRSVAGLRSTAGTETGLAAAIGQAARQLTETKDVQLRLSLADDPIPLPPETKYNLLRIAQEAISNAVRHSGGRTIDVALDRTDGLLTLSVSDDGSGTAVEPVDPAVLGHFGLLGMRERASQIGADFHVDSQRGRGTSIRVVLPLDSGHHP